MRSQSPDRTRFLRPIVIAITSFVFAAAGAAKLAGAQQMSDLFDRFALPASAATATGVIEIAGAVGLLVPLRTIRRTAAVLLFITMLFAAGFHLLNGPPVAALPAFALIVVTGLIAVRPSPSAARLSAGAIRPPT